MTLRSHAVLAGVSPSYPPPTDRCLRVTHPSATAGLPQPCDLHVLSMPPAFALSQDQTLRFITPHQHPCQQAIMNRPNSLPTQPKPSQAPVRQKNFRNICLRIIQDTPTNAPQATARSYPIQPSQPKPHDSHHRPGSAANVSLPSRFCCQGTTPRSASLSGRSPG